MGYNSKPTALLQEASAGKAVFHEAGLAPLSLIRLSPAGLAMLG